MAGTDIESFRVNKQQFEMVAETRCAINPERHLEPFNEEPDKDLIPPINATSQAQAMTKTCRSMFTPFCLVEHVIGQDLSFSRSFRNPVACHPPKESTGDGETFGAFPNGRHCQVQRPRNSQNH